MEQRKSIVITEENRLHFCNVLTFVWFNTSRTVNLLDYPSTDVA